MNILTVMNEDYSSYGRIFFSSLSKLSDYNKIEKIYVIDTGMEEETKAEFLSSYDRIWFIDSEVNHAKTSHNAQDWREIVATKVKGLSSLVEAGESPICMIDIDCFFKENFIDEVQYTGSDHNFLEQIFTPIKSKNADMILHPNYGNRNDLCCMQKDMVVSKFVTDHL